MKVILSINSEMEREAIKNSLTGFEIVSEVVIADNISDAVYRMNNDEFDAAILYLKSESEDMMQVLFQIQDIKHKNESARVIILTDKADETFSSAAAIFGIDHVFVSPYDLSDIVSNVVYGSSDEVAAEMEAIDDKKISAERMTSSILSGTGIFPNLKGYKYLKEAIVTGYTRRNTLDAVTKYLYPEIADKNNTTADRVERAIRHAIESAWNKCDGNGFYNKMGFGNAYNGKRPTNSEYIFAVVEYLNNHIGWYKKYVNLLQILICVCLILFFNSPFKKLFIKIRYLTVW